MAKYLYCLVRGQGERDGFPTGVEGAAISSICVREVLACVSDVTNDLPPLSVANVLAHHAVVEHALSCFPAVLPCRFGTVAANHEKAVALLEARYSQLVESLDVLQGSVEISIKVLLPGNALPTDNSQKAQREVGATEGMRYLLQKRTQYHRAQYFEAQTEQLKQSLQAAASAFIGAIKAEHAPLEQGLMVTFHCLLKRTQLASFKQHYHHWQRGHPHMRFLYTGPWPPYTFAALDLRR